ncbi:hypothetical protein COU58_03815 [Candidatus Pacearchaeota archaeon CG10_big_fil_rev_8_21_14_0_10_32_42]|nr:MAG: hypothetical protein COU58_03815 [Candidatus Pacearchaeota archaeon CG10_big_fil_rev_8_21_14_0_10_32_42]
MRRLDNKRQLVDYFKKNLAKNYTEESLEFALVSQGYSRVAIEEALIQAHKEIAEKAPLLKEKPVIKYSLYNENNEPVHVEPFTFWEKVKFFFRGKKF